MRKKERNMSEINILRKILNDVSERLLTLEAVPHINAPWPQVGDKYEYIGQNGGVVLSHYSDGEVLPIGNFFKPGTAKNSLIYKIRHSDYEYWIAGLSDVLEDLPENCQYRIGLEWRPEKDNPSSWGISPRRWPKQVRND